ncbi:lipopolysaccharide biosynthesis protein [Thomasclavelia spiroformis]|uniref:lipopolysaccharide biosynthesis protein n=1 Tax=Thomasclavelia spiroformis TaxID=29348 RepID=UPI000B3A7471|nr:hypothetical protein [Thomasclavelia spiroformis]OUO70305.1 hypothetical protein B5F64_06540 [Thomasclavelia spiroformis]
MKNITKNMSLSVMSRIITMITGIVIQNQILVFFGSSLNGLTSSITQITSYLALIEAGIGMASIQALYSPLAKNDWDEVNGILSATGREYKKITLGFMSLLFGVSVSYPLLINGQVEYAIASWLTFLIGASNIISYIVGGKYKALLTADQKIYILYILDIIVAILSCIVRILLLKLGMGILIVQFAYLMCVLIKNLGYYLYVKKKYGSKLKDSKPLMNKIGQRWSVLIHNIAGMVVNQTDVTLLTIFATLKDVSIYSVYYLVFGQLISFIQMTFLTAPLATFGKQYNEDRDKFVNFYKIYEFGFTIFMSIICSVTLCLILPFISIYTKDVHDANYIDTFIPILFTLILFLNQIRIPAIICINVAGHFKETQLGAIIEAIINLTVSVALLCFTNLGIYGLLIGTVCSFCYRTVDVILYAYRKILKTGIINYLKTLFINLVVLLIIVLLFFWMYPLNCKSYLQWIVKACEVTLFTTICFVCINFIFNRKLIKIFFNTLKKWLK